MASNKTTTDQNLDIEEQNQRKVEYQAQLESALDQIKEREIQISESYKKEQARVAELRKAHAELTKKERELDDQIKQINDEVHIQAPVFYCVLFSSRPIVRVLLGNIERFDYRSYTVN